MTFHCRQSTIYKSTDKGEPYMNKFYAAITVLALSLALGVTAMAQGKMAGKAANQAGCSACEKAGATPEQLRKFRSDSLDLRQAMMNKRFDLERENLKETPDSARVAAIKAEMEAIRAKIDALKTAANLPQSASCGMEGCPLPDGNCDKCMSGTMGNRSGCSQGKACGKPATAPGNCANCNKPADCGSMNCGKAACDTCGKSTACGCRKKGNPSKK
jgi:hypothetical protein